MAALARVVEPEWLDALPAADPRALRSRRELRRVNFLMANAGIVARALQRAHPAAIGTLAEVGAGDGAFALRLARRLRPAPGATLLLLDREAVPEAATLRAAAARGWQAHALRADVFDWLRAEAPRCDAIVANLFLHHFEGAALARLLAGVAARTRCFVACEPRRSALALAGARALALAGCGEVTRHDAVASVRAGFRGGELTALWPAAGWRVEEGAAGAFSHRFVAVRA